MIKIYTQKQRGQDWLERYRGQRPVFACILGFTETGLIPGISAAGATPTDRQYTAIADGEFLLNGVQPRPQYPLPPLSVGASPAFISRAVIEALNISTYLFNAGLPQPPSVPAIDLGGVPASCLTSGKALPQETVCHLFQQGIVWGEKLARAAAGSYLLVGECVVGGTTTALALLTGLGIQGAGKVNSSHPQCNHQQKWSVVQAGLQAAHWIPPGSPANPLALVAAVGDPMQAVAAGIALGASPTAGVLLAGGTQMLAVYALARALLHQLGNEGHLNGVVVGTTRWVAEDLTGDAVGLAEELDGVSLLGAQLCFSDSQHLQFQSYERGYVKEGVGAGGCAIAAHLYRGWRNEELVRAVDSLLARYNSKEG
jgi:uncharacterized protein (TIGR00303 family)